jgi:hypothetical protein
MVFKKLFSKFFCVCLLSRKFINGKNYPFEGKFGLIFRKIIILDEKYFLKVVKNL